MAAQQMKDLAEELAAAHGLDFSLASLAAFEKLVKKHQRSLDDAATTRWGAYLGETIRRSRPDAVRWADFATAVREIPSVATVGEASETAFVLIVGTRCWFPMVKLNKFVAKGAADSPAAFARVAIGSASPAVAAAAFDPSAIAEADARYVRGFFAKPSVETLDALSHARTHLRHDEVVYLLREANARPAAFYPFFGMKAEGRFEVGLAAAGQVAKLFDYQLADFASEATTLATMLASPDKLVRGNAAFVLGRYHFGAGDRTAATAHYAAGDAVVRDGLLVGLRSAVFAIVKDRVGPRDPAELAPVLLAALRGKASERTLALHAIEQIAGRGRTDVGWALDGLLEVLDDGKPAQIECALHALGSQAGSIERGRCPYDARIGASVAAVVRHAKAVAGKVKVTKVQIAAKYVVADYVDIAEHFDAKQRAALAKATEASQNIR